MKTAHKIMPQEKTSLQVTKFIKAPAAKVYVAWARAELMSKWFAPDMSAFTPEVESDFRVGGHYRICMRQADKAPTVGGKYLEIAANRKIVFTWVWEGTPDCGASPTGESVKVDSIVTLEFSEKNGGTEITLTHERLPNKDQVNRHTEGWMGCLANLVTFAEK